MSIVRGDSVPIRESTGSQRTDEVDLGPAGVKDADSDDMKSEYGRWSARLRGLEA